MSAYTVNYLLPALLGYTLYVGIASRWSLTRPQILAKRPSWMFGVWTGLTVSGVLIATLHLASGISVADAVSLLPFAGIALAALLCFGAAIALSYRSSVRSRIEPPTDTTAASLDMPLLAFDDVEPNVDEDIIATDLNDGLDVDMNNAVDELVIEREDTIDAEQQEHIEEFEHVEHVDIEIEEIEAQGVDSVETADLSLELTAQLESERQQRAEVEQHLVITRKALHRLEEQPRIDANHQNTIAELESRLVEATQQISAAESRAERESFARIESDNTVNELREDVAIAHTDLRRNVEARAKALSTASKSIALARTANKARRRVESKAEELETTLENRQQTISSLIKSLEREKRRSQEEVSRRARELILHERQMRSRKNLEEVSRSVEGNLTSRLVKKVARSRTLTNNS